MSAVIEAPEAWAALCARIDAEGGMVFLLGASDSGKTTLALWLLRTLTSAGRHVALLDGDIGQSTLGPPATAGLTIANVPCTESDLHPIALRFVGAVSPVQQMLPLAVALKRLAEKAYGMGAGVLLVDTTGLVLGPLGRRLKCHKIELLAPQHLVALQKNAELEPILRLFEGRKGMAISRLPVSPQVTARSAQARRLYRAQRFFDYFQASSHLELSLREIVVEGSWMQGGRLLDVSELRGLSKELETPVLGGERGDDEVFLLVQGEPSSDALALAKSRLGVSVFRIIERDTIRGLLLGLADDENELLALGLLQDLDPTTGRLVCLTPFSDRGAVRIVHFGSLCLEPSGQEMGEFDIYRARP